MGNTNNSIQHSIQTDDLLRLKHYVKAEKYKNAKLRCIDCPKFISEEVKEYLTKICLINVEIIKSSESKNENTTGDTHHGPTSKKHKFKSSDTADSGVEPYPTSEYSTIQSGTNQLCKEVVETEDIYIVLTVKSTRVEVDARFALAHADVSRVDPDNTILLVFHKTGSIKAAEYVHRLLYRHAGIKDTIHVPYQKVEGTATSGLAPLASVNVEGEEMEGSVACSCKPTKPKEKDVSRWFLPLLDFIRIAVKLCNHVGITSLLEGVSRLFWPLLVSIMHAVKLCIPAGITCMLEDMIKTKFNNYFQRKCTDFPNSPQRPSEEALSRAPETNIVPAGRKSTENTSFKRNDTKSSR